MLAVSGNLRDMVKLPAPGITLRRCGAGSPWERLACGVQDKSGIVADWPFRRPDTWSLVHVLRGRGSYRDADGRTWDLAAGACFVRQPGIPHSTTLDPGSGWLECFVGIGPCLAAALQRAAVMPATEPVWMWGVRQARTARFVALRAALADQPLPQLMAQAIGLIAEASIAAESVMSNPPMTPR